MNYSSVKRFSVILEYLVVGYALIALIYRATFYWLWPPAAGETYGLGDIVDFGLGLGLFFLSLLCAASAVVMSLKGQGQEQHLAFRPAVVGITTFVVYYFLHPYVPQFM